MYKRIKNFLDKRRKKFKYFILFKMIQDKNIRIENSEINLPYKITCIQDIARIEDYIHYNTPSYKEVTILNYQLLDMNRKYFVSTYFYHCIDKGK